MTFSEVISLDGIKNDFYTMLLNGEFSKGGMLCDYYDSDIILWLDIDFFAQSIY